MITIRRIFASLLLALGCAGAAAQSSDTLLTRAAVEDRVLAAHPSLQAGMAAVEAARSGVSLSELPRPWAIVMQLENVAGTGIYSGASAGELSISAEREFELSATRTARISAAQTEVALAQADLSIARRELRAEARRRYLRAARLQLRLEERAATIERLDRARAQVERWMGAGRSPESELLQAEIAITKARLEHDDARHEYDAARLALAALWGDRSISFQLDAGSLDALPDVAAFEELAARLPNAEAERRLSFEAERLAADLDLARASARPPLTLSIGTRRLEASADQVFIIGARLPLGTARRSGLTVQRADARQREFSAQREALRRESHQRLYAAYQELMHARHVYETYRDEVAPRAEKAAAVTRRGYELGRMNYLSLSQAEQLLTETRTVQLDAAARYHDLWQVIESLTAEFGADSQ